MGDTVADTEKMEVSRSSEKIDMTLDEIIELNKKEQKEQKATSGVQRTKNKRMANRNYILKKIGRDGQLRFPFKRGAYQIQQGPYRPRFFRPYRQGFYGKRPNNFKRGPPNTSGVSPLNRKPWNTTGTEPLRRSGVKTRWFNRKFYQPYRHPAWRMRRTPQPFVGRKFPHAEQKQGQGKTRQFTLNRTFLARKMNDRFGKYQKVRSWRKTPSSGSILTVSVLNTKTAPEPPATVKQSTVTDVSETGAEPVTQPKGIPLRFNFKAVANQTGVSLNDRFTGLKIRGGAGHRPWRGRGRGRGRMVTLP